MSTEVKETFLGLTKFRALTIGLVVVIINFTLAVFAGYYASNKQGNKLDTNQNALAYICSTTQVIDQLVVTGRNELKLALKPGSTTQNLIKRGILPESENNEIRKDIAIYNRDDATLKANGACQSITN